MFVQVLILTSFIYVSNCGVVNLEASGCTIVIDPDNHDPVVVSADSLEPLYPETPNLDIAIKKGSTVLVGCPGGTLTYGNEKAKLIEATCVTASTFTVNGTKTSLKSLHCSKVTKNTARFTNKTCELDGQEIEIGFSLDKSRFVRLMRLCWDDALKSSWYSQYTLTSKIGNYQVGAARPAFIEDKFYNLDVKVNDLYSRDSQRSVMNKLLGLEESSLKYVAKTSDYYLARGHFTAKTDFVFSSQQRATFHLINSAPQWQTLNAANWLSIEDSVRDYASDNNLDLEVYTGGHDVMTLPHEETGEQTKLYLYVDENNNPLLPIPRLYWKLVFNPENGGNIVFISENNPYNEDVKPICEDVSSKIDWITWKQDNMKGGYSYACLAEEAKKVITQIPGMDFGDILI